MQNKLKDGLELSKSDAVFRVMKNNASATLEAYTDNDSLGYINVFVGRP